MRKIIVLVIFLMLFLINGNSVFASDLVNISNTMSKLYKKAILTKYQIQIDYSEGDKINSKIEKFFIGLYFKNDRISRLKETEKKMGDLIEKYENKKLNTKQKKSLNIIKNIYYRAVIELNK